MHDEHYGHAAFDARDKHNLRPERSDQKSLQLQPRSHAYMVREAGIVEEVIIKGPCPDSAHGYWAEMWGADDKLHLTHTCNHFLSASLRKAKWEAVRLRKVNLQKLYADMVFAQNQYVTMKNVIAQGTRAVGVCRIGRSL